MVGRWVGHWRSGVFAHGAIAKAVPVKGELALGWLAHYVTGVAFGALLAGVCGLQRVHSPTFLPALAFGLGTVAAPWLLMQPAMGAGLASSKTPSPAMNLIPTPERLLEFDGFVFGSPTYLGGVSGTFKTFMTRRAGSGKVTL